jgi:hypothetical protein
MPREKAEFARGTKVGVRFSGRVVPAVIVEDRGIFNDHRVVRIRLGELDDDDALEWELRAEKLEPLPTAAAC